MGELLAANTPSHTPRVSVVIPTLNAERELYGLLSALITQTLAPSQILVVDSSSDDATVAIAQRMGAITWVIPRSSFDHGGTRHEALLRTDGDIVCFMTQDAIPADDHTIERLVAPLMAGEAQASYARQLPKREAHRYTELVQLVNYPPESQLRSIEDVQRMGIHAYYLSDVCSAYDRTTYLELDGFERPLRTNEDMLMAARILRSGGKVAYQADACVYHSHNLSPMQQFKRNRAVGAFLSSHSSELEGPTETQHGAQLFSRVMNALVHERRPVEIVGFAVDCAARLAGNRIGRWSGR